MATVLVTGATGNIGAPLTRMLVEAGVSVRVLTRRLDEARSSLGDNVLLTEGGIEDASAVAAALDGAEQVFFLSRTTPEIGEAAKAFLALAKDAGVRRVVATSSSTVALEPSVAMGRWHADLESALVASGLGWTALRPGNFASNTLRWAGSIRSKATVFAPYAGAVSAPIDPFDIAAVAFAALTSSGHDAKVHTLTGPELMTPRKQTGVLGHVLGRPISLIELTEDRAREGMIAGGMPPFMADAIVELLRASAGEELITSTVREITGRDARSFETWAREHRSQFV